MEIKLFNNVKRFFIYIGLLAIGFQLDAGMITVCNDNNIIAQYTDLQTAIDAANTGDTLYVYGSPNSYGSVNIDKELFMFGIGHDPAKFNMESSKVDSINLKNGSSGSVISGFSLDEYSISADTLIHNILIENSFFNTVNSGFSFLNSLDSDNWIIRGCWFNGHASSSTPCVFKVGVNNSNWLISNNIFDYYIRLDDLNATTVFTNNLVVRSRNYSSSDIYTYIFYNSNNSLIQNNIFVFTSSSASTYCDFHSCTSGTYNNNLTWTSYYTSPLLEDLPGSDDSGSDNINNTDPLFLDFANTSGNHYNYTRNIHVSDTSAIKNAGTDGTDIGPYGGSFNFSLVGNSSLPRVTQFYVNNPILQLGDTIKINVKAVSPE